LPGNIFARSIDDSAKYRIDNFGIRVKNCGSKSVFNVIVYDNYMKSVLTPNDCFEVYATYNDRIDNNEFTDGLLEIDPTMFAKSEHGSTQVKLL
jgi:hypothetical protein